MAGILVTAKANLNDVYTSEEIALVKAVATLITLVIECIRALNKLDGTNTREFVLQETNQLINEFLNLTSHELRTPLTATMGNIQLAQRRLEALKRHATDLSDTLSKYIKQVQQPLENASQSAQLQEQIIRNMIDDARIQSHTLTLHMRRCNLIKLVQEVVAKRQQQAPERRIILDIRHTEETVPIIADADRIKQVIDTYLTNALNYSPGDRAVTVQLTVEGSMARVSVHDEGPRIVSIAARLQGGRGKQTARGADRIVLHGGLHANAGLGGRDKTRREGFVQFGRNVWRTGRGYHSILIQRVILLLRVKAPHRVLVGGESWIRTLGTAPVACQMSSCTRIAEVVETDDSSFPKFAPREEQNSRSDLLLTQICTPKRISDEPGQPSHSASVCPKSRRTSDSSSCRHTT